MKKQGGMSLSEVLISLFLSSLILTSLMQFYLNSKEHYLKEEQLLEEELELKWVSELLSNSIRRAGFTPCLDLGQLRVIDTRYHYSPSIKGIKLKNSSGQIIQINRMSEYFSKLVDIPNIRQLRVSHGGLFHKKHPVLIADCAHAEIHQIESIIQHANAFLITLKKPLQFNYDSSTYVGEFIEEQWFIKKNSKGEGSFFYQSIQAEELSSLINSLEINRQGIVDKEFIEVIIGLAKGSFRKISVLVRGL